MLLFILVNREKNQNKYVNKFINADMEFIYKHDIINRSYVLNTKYFIKRFSLTF